MNDLEFCFPDEWPCMRGKNKNPPHLLSLAFHPPFMPPLVIQEETTEQTQLGQRTMRDRKALTRTQLRELSPVWFYSLFSVGRYLTRKMSA